MGKTRQLLINAARDVFAQLGVKRTTMNDIDEASNKGRRTLYTYFKSKEDVYMAVVSQELELLMVRLKQLMKTKLSPEEKLIEFLSHINSSPNTSLPNYIRLTNRSNNSNGTSISE